MQHQDDSTSSQQKRNQLPPLAPRHSQSSSSRDRASGSTTASGRPPRLSHRSRAGCWTCRARKVKCDEIHPKCGPCTRLSRSCDWDHRWNFNDATQTTQSKYTNVLTSGNSVWDPQARRSPDSSPDLRQVDDMPAFAVLTSDDERERKAGTQMPGTFGVVVTPESFADLPEYTGSAFSGSRRESIQSQASSLAIQIPNPTFGRVPSRSQTDPNVIVLDRFEDATPPSAGLYALPLESRRPSLPDRIQHLAILKPPPSPNNLLPLPTLGLPLAHPDPLVSHFRHHLLPQLIQPQLDDLDGDILTTKTRDVFETEAFRFPPLCQAICALSALNLSYSGAGNVDSAHAHYGQALSSQTTASMTQDLFSNGTFLRHFLLFVYDICIPMQQDDGAASNMWAIHLEHLQHIAKLRHERLGPERHGYIIWTICELDTFACLLGSGDCSFVRTIVQNNMMPALEQQLPSTPNAILGPYLADEIATFPAILELRQGVMMQMANLAQVARGFRLEARDSVTVSPGSYARWQATVSQLQSELIGFWIQAYPQFLVHWYQNPHLALDRLTRVEKGHDSPQAGMGLPDRPRYVFEQAFVLYQAATIYSRTSMFLRQRSIPIAHRQDVLADTENRIMAIITIATAQLQLKQLERRHVIFPLFMAGIATLQPDVKIQVLDIIKAYEGRGIGQNTYTTRRLLAAVYEEQRRVAAVGGSIEDVDWLQVARARSLTVVNCGL